VSKPISKGKDATPREAINSAAIRLFGAMGYNGTTMRDIAQEVGILAGSLYAHIDSKESLLAEIVHTGIEPYLEILRSLDGVALSPTEKLRAAIVTHVKVVAANPERTFVVFHEWRFLKEPYRAKVVKMRRRYGDGFTKIVADGVACGEFSSELVLRVSVFGILGALNWIPEWFSPDGPSSADEIGNQLADALIGGLRAPR
jgi:AcrR family transcriptional regulator